MSEHHSPDDRPLYQQLDRTVILTQEEREKARYVDRQDEPYSGAGVLEHASRFFKASAVLTLIIGGLAVLSGTGATVSLGVNGRPTSTFGFGALIAVVISAYVWWAIAAFIDHQLDMAADVRAARRDTARLLAAIERRDQRPPTAT